LTVRKRNECFPKLASLDLRFLGFVRTCVEAFVVETSSPEPLFVETSFGADSKDNASFVETFCAETCCGVDSKAKVLTTLGTPPLVLCFLGLVSAFADTSCAGDSDDTTSAILDNKVQTPNNTVVETKRVETKRVETKRVETKRVETKRVETKRVETKQRWKHTRTHDSLRKKGSACQKQTSTHMS
jgi:hypothetical protein